MPKVVRLRVSNWQSRNGIVYVLRTGIAWEEPSLTRGDGSGMICWRRLRDRQASDVWHRLHHGVADRATSRQET
ncbi:hypothetical protein XalbCFBP2523_11580 [Xanthomonas albilineans]|nr:hypothetical protein XalbCFBP2523_11580 [Xanthomonas albilineans]